MLIFKSDFMFCQKKNQSLSALKLNNTHFSIVQWKFKSHLNHGENFPFGIYIVYSQNYIFFEKDLSNHNLMQMMGLDVRLLFGLDRTLLFELRLLLVRIIPDGLHRAKMALLGRFTVVGFELGQLILPENGPK